MWPNDVGTFKRPLAGVQVYKKFVFRRIHKNVNKKLNHDLWDTLLHFNNDTEIHCAIDCPHTLVLGNNFTNGITESVLLGVDFYRPT